MTTDNTIYLPLSSNMAWFENDVTFAKLERYLKLAVVIYDTVKIQNGRLHLSAGEDGQGMMFPFFGDSFPGDRAEFKPYKQGSPFQIAIGGKTVMASTSAFAVDVDFMPVAIRAGIQNEAFIEWINFGLKPGLQEKLERFAREELLTGDLDQYLPENTYLKQQLLPFYFKDAVLSYVMNVPLLLDHKIAKLASGAASRIGGEMRRELRHSALHAWLALKLPNFGEWEWDEVLTYRNSASGADFRSMVTRVCESIRQQVAGECDEEEILHEAQAQIVKELISEIFSRRSTIGKTSLSLALNVIPFNLGSIIGVGLDLNSLLAEKRCWVSVLDTCDSPAQ